MKLQDPDLRLSGSQRWDYHSSPPPLPLPPTWHFCLTAEINLALLLLLL